MSITTYNRLADRIESTVNRKGSRFIGLGFPVSEEELQEAIAEVRSSYPDATHVVYGSRTLKEGRPIDRYENDGEPSGTAGEPVLDLLQGRDLLETCICVVRYFGGTELGTGGLVRAYGDSARAVLEGGSVETRTVRREVTVEYPHSATGAVMDLLEAVDGELLDLEYGQRPKASVSVPVTEIDRFRKQLAGATSGDFELGEPERR